MHTRTVLAICAPQNYTFLFCPYLLCLPTSNYRLIFTVNSFRDANSAIFVDRICPKPQNCQDFLTEHFGNGHKLIRQRQISQNTPEQRSHIQVFKHEKTAKRFTFQRFSQYVCFSVIQRSSFQGIVSRDCVQRIFSKAFNQWFFSQTCFN